MLAPNVSFGSVGYWEASGSPEPSTISARGMIKGTLYIGAAAVLLFLLVPGLDITVAHHFYEGGRHFIGSSSPVIRFSRGAFNLFFYLTCALTVAGLIISARAAGSWLGFKFNKWLFLALCLIVGPLVVTNIGLKDHWGRARPRNVIEFGGSRTFTSPFRPSNQCVRNCSFVSGEASSVYIVFFAGAFLLRRNSRKMVALGIVFGSLAGLVRMAQGGHFLSDIAFAGVFMALTAATLQLLFDTIQSAGRAEPQETTA
jgi:lipid A 4'-phosphatase